MEKHLNRHASTKIWIFQSLIYNKVLDQELGFTFGRCIINNEAQSGPILKILGKFFYIAHIGSG